MTENPTNQPSQPVDSGNGNATPSESRQVPNASRRARPGHFASDGRAPRRDVPVQPQSHSDTSAVPPEAPETPASPAAASKRFEAGSQQSVSPKQAQPQAQRPSPVPVGPVRTPIDAPFERVRLFILAAIMVPLCIWGTWDSWKEIVYTWYHSDDYSHGFIVVPATLLFLYLRQETYPGTRHRLDWVGLFPILIYGVLRIVSGQFYMAALDQVAIWFWILSVVWFFYGWRVFLWALPSLLFLVFMFQLPYSVDVLMRNRLQMFAAHSAAALLQTIGVAAIPITNTIRLSTTELGVEAACSGLRFLMSVFAIAFATALLMRRPWWQNILILVIAAPLALFVNAIRIAITGVLLEYWYDWTVAWLTVEGLKGTVESGGFASTVAGILLSVTSEGQSVSVAADAFAGKIGIVLNVRNKFLVEFLSCRRIQREVDGSPDINPFAVVHWITSGIDMVMACQHKVHIVCIHQLFETRLHIVLNVFVCGMIGKAGDRLVSLHKQPAVFPFVFFCRSFKRFVKMFGDYLRSFILVSRIRRGTQHNEQNVIVHIKVISF